MCSSHLPCVCALPISRSIQTEAFHNLHVCKPACPRHRSHRSLLLSGQTPLTNHTCNRSPVLCSSLKPLTNHMCNRSPILCSSPKPLALRQPLLRALSPVHSISSASGAWPARTKSGEAGLLLLGQLLTSRRSIVLRGRDFDSCEPLKAELSAHLLWFQGRVSHLYCLA